MKIRINELRNVIRTVLQEVYEHDEEYYDDTVLPDEASDRDWE